VKSAHLKTVLLEYKRFALIAGKCLISITANQISSSRFSHLSLTIYFLQKRHGFCRSICRRLKLAVLKIKKNASAFDLFSPDFKFLIFYEQGNFYEPGNLL
jgi:hypothetical protein